MAKLPADPQQSFTPIINLLLPTASACRGDAWMIGYTGQERLSDLHRSNYSIISYGYYLSSVRFHPHSAERCSD